MRRNYFKKMSDPLPILLAEGYQPSCCEDPEGRGLLVTKSYHIDWLRVIIIVNLNTVSISNLEC